MTAAEAQVISQGRGIVAVVVGAVGGDEHTSILENDARSMSLGVVAEAGQRSGVNNGIRVDATSNFDELRVRGDDLGWNRIADTALSRARGCARPTEGLGPVARRRELSKSNSRKHDGGDAHCASVRVKVNRYAARNTRTQHATAERRKSHFFSQ